MKLNLAFVLATLSLLGLVSINDSQPNKSSSAATLLSPKTQTINSQTGKAALDRKGRLLDKLKTLLEPLGVTVNKSALIDGRAINSYRQLIIEWESYPGSTQALIKEAEAKKQRPAGNMIVKEDKQHSGSLRQLNEIRFSEDQIFVIAVDANNQLRWWDLLDDPRILRAETEGPNREVMGGTYYRAKVEMFITPPDNGAITELRFFLPKWTGTEFILEPLSVVPLTK